jgi:hypothetical protein
MRARPVRRLTLVRRVRAGETSTGPFAIPRSPLHPLQFPGLRSEPSLFFFGAMRTHCAVVRFPSPAPISRSEKQTLIIFLWRNSTVGTDRPQYP